MNFATFDLNLLKVLDALFREGSTIKAAARLGMSQSAVSGALARLRHAMGDQLFVRHGNRFVPTDYATALQTPLREELDRLQALLAPPGVFDPATTSGVFRIAGSDFFAEMLMPALGKLLGRTSPDLRAQLIDTVPHDHVASLERYNADLALIPDVDLPDWANREPLFRAPFCAIARRDHPALAGLAPGDPIPMELFCTLGQVAFSPEGEFSGISDVALARVGRRRRVVMTVPVFSGVCRAVAESDLIGMVPMQLAVRLAPAFGLVRFAPPMDPPEPLVVGIWHKRADTTPMAAWMRGQIFGLMRALSPDPSAPDARA